MTASIVMDASITLAWLFNEDGAAVRIEPVMNAHELVAPPLWLLEVTNAILVQERRRRIVLEQSRGLLELIDSLPIELIPEPSHRTAAGIAQLARVHQLSTYDASYLDLASRLGLPLFTRDSNLRDAAGRVGVELVQENASNAD